MKIPRSKIWCCAAALTCIVGASRAATVQDRAHFELAMHGGEPAVVYSTAPYYVRIGIVDARNGSHWRGCVTADELKRAIRIENGIAPDEYAQEDRVVRIAIDNVRREYRFSNARALAALPMKRYGASDLMRARRFLDARHLNPQNWEEKSAGAGYLNQVALACALVEKGYSAIRGDRPYVTIPQ